MKKLNLIKFLPIIETFSQLKKLSLTNLVLENINGLKSLSQLEEIELSNNYLKSIEELVELNDLRLVKLTNNPIDNSSLLPTDIVILK